MGAEPIRQNAVHAEALREQNPAPEPIVGHIPNFGFMRLNWDGPSSAEKTLIVTGVEPADGAAIIANAIRQLGIPVFFFPAGAGIRGLGGRAASSGFADHARKLTEQYGTWGARVPFRSSMVTAARRAALNPHTIIVMEDPAAVAIGIEHSAEGGAPAALARAAERIVELALFAADLSLPTMIVSIQKAREFAAAHIDALAMFIGANPTPEARLAAIALIDQGARTLNPTPLGFRSIQGALDKAQKRGQVSGWAKQPLSNVRVKVRALVNGVEAGEAIADEPRSDLVRHKIGDGNHGFKIDLKHLLTADVQTVQVIAVEDSSLIGTAAMTKDSGQAIG